MSGKAVNVRGDEMLTPDIPPLRFEGVETDADGLIAEADMLALFGCSVAMPDELEDACTMAGAA